LAVVRGEVAAREELEEEREGGRRPRWVH